MLEAFVIGCPVVAARIPSVAEIAGEDAALLLEPTDVPAWADAIDRIASRSLPPQMVEAGRRRAQRFTWSGCADSVIKLMAPSAERGPT